VLLLIVILSALLAFLSARLFSRKVSPVYAILAAAGGLRLAQGEPVLALWGYPFSWFVAPILAAGLAALLTFLTEQILRKSGAHLFHRMRVMGNLIKYSKYLLIACAALNFRPLLIRGTGFVFEWLIPVAVYLAALAVVCVLFKSEYKAVMSSDYDLSLPEKFASLLAVSAVLLLFSIGPAAGLVRLPAGIGTETMLRLPAGPHSALLLLMAAVVGCRLADGWKLRDCTDPSAATSTLVVAPALAFFLSFVLTSIHLPGEHEPRVGTWVLILGLLVLLLTVLLVIIFYRTAAERRRAALRLSDRDEEIHYERSKVNELQVKLMQAENEHAQAMMSMRKDNIKGMAELVRKSGGTGRDDLYSRMEEIDEDFPARLAFRYPQLTENERKLASFLRLDFSSREIAVIMGIEPKSVEIERHRMRRKMGLTRNQSLTAVIKSI
jgi:DNA-binding CsgD family transcriptional regulator/phosphate/sulfate permease